MVAIQVFCFCSSTIIYFKYGLFFGSLLGVLSLVYSLVVWTSIVCLESMAGNHLSHMVDGIKFSFVLFLFSEVMFFFGIFWAYFDSALSPPIELGEMWPPMGIIPINPYGIPLFNTVVLLSSGATSTWAHSSLLMNKNALFGMVLTLILAFMFELAQFVEFKTASFSMSDGVFGSLFFFGTGFHGLHVLFGHTFLIYNSFRIYWLHFTRSQHVGLELALMYWHFVDVVWLMLYLCVYWWAY